jgi:hypothetical protein
LIPIKADLHEPQASVSSLAAIISPRTPLQNVARLRRVLRTLRGVVWWADPHFSARALEDLAEELDLSNVKEVRILSGDASNVITRRANADFQRFTEELANHGVPASWLVDRQRDWHDRWLFDNKGGYNMPPINTLYKGDYAEILPTNARPPLEAWFARSTSW